MLKTKTESLTALLDTLLSCLDAISKGLYNTLNNDVFSLIPKYSSSKLLGMHLTTLSSIDKCLKMSLISTDSAVFHNTTDPELILANLESLMVETLPGLCSLLSELVDDLTLFHEHSYVIDTKSIVELLKLRRLDNVLTTMGALVVPKLHTLLTKCSKYSTSFNSCEYFDLKNYRKDSVLITDLIHDEDDDDFDYEEEFEILEKALELLLLESDLGEESELLEEFFDDDVFELDLENDYQMVKQPAIPVQLENHLNLNRLVTIC